MQTTDSQRLKSMGISLRMARENLRFSFRELAELSGVSASHILRMESGEFDFSVSKFIRVTESLGLSVGIVLESAMFNRCPRERLRHIREDEFLAVADRNNSKTPPEKLDCALEMRSFVQGVAEMVAALIASSNPVGLSDHLSHSFEKVNFRIDEFALSKHLIGLKHYERHAMVEALLEDPYNKLKNFGVIDDELLFEFCEWARGKNMPADLGWSYQLSWAGSHIARPKPVPAPSLPKDKSPGTTKNHLTERSEFRTTSGDMKSALKGLLDKVRKLTKPSGMKAKLAADLGVPQARVSEWLSGKYDPAGETTLQLLHWVEQQERQPSR